VGADHQHGTVLAAAPGGRDVAVAVDVHGIGQPVHALAEILDEGLLESGDAVEGDQIPQRLAERVLDRRRTIGHRETLYGPGRKAVKGGRHGLMGFAVLTCPCIMRAQVRGRPT
jgi:hypothetical protein